MWRLPTFVSCDSAITHILNTLKWRHLSQKLKLNSTETKAQNIASKSARKTDLNTSVAATLRTNTIVAIQSVFHSTIQVSGNLKRKRNSNSNSSFCNPNVTRFLFTCSISRNKYLTHSVRQFLDSFEIPESVISILKADSTIQKCLKILKTWRNSQIIKWQN